MSLKYIHMEVCLEMADGIGALKGYGIAIGALAIICLTTMAVITGFKETGQVDNTTAEKFVAGIAIFGTFVGVLILAMMGKVIVGMYKGA